MFKDGKATSVLVMNTLAFTVCFAVWMTNGVLVTFLVERGLYDWGPAEMGWLIGMPVLTGALFRLPVGVLTDKYGGRMVFVGVMLISAFFMFLLGFGDSYSYFMVLSLGFGVAGASFAVGIAYTSVWFRKEHQGTALGIFGAGNAGAAFTSIAAPKILLWLTDNGENLEGWRTFPKLYSLALVVMTVIFFLFTHHKVVAHGQEKTLGERLAPLRNVRVWRFGLYYFYVFGGFVALAQWLIPYYVNVYMLPIATAGLMASIFTLPSGVIRALGGWMSDVFGARKIMYWVFGTCLVCSALLVFPRMEVFTPGAGIMAKKSGTVTAVTDDAVVVDQKTRYPISTRREIVRGTAVFPRSEKWHEVLVVPGEGVRKRQLIARGNTKIYFEANMWIFTILVFIIGIMMGIGKAAVYKHIPDYFPEDVGVVGGIVGVLGGLGGFFCPILFGYLLKGTGLWTSCWMFFAVLVAICLYWMHWVIERMLRGEAPQLARQMDAKIT